ncbi:CerR family C-terminal domain-containing protein [uncultured Desulfuromusa sp.]|uniref:CerR family C-terminal domain-containing protein n=1 Tax=uncultured Desulfuromusa sp. TaxID=219183 RepID=UPI002AA696A8|nr:CerR family C-terminal domain-containing protein [uncultured Desulfuromusa sp.]
MPQVTKNRTKRRTLPKRRDALETRSRLLTAAGQAFAEYGFKGANLREICQTAKVNLGAVTYYFGDKEQLYREALIAPHREMVNQDPPPNFQQFADPEPALKEWIFYFLRLTLIRRPAHPYLSKLVTREIIHPSIALNQLVDLVFTKVRGELVHIIAIMINRPPEDREVGTLANMTIMLCIQQEIGRAVLERFNFPPPESEEEIRELTEKVYRFSRAGIMEWKEIH